MAEVALHARPTRLHTSPPASLNGRGRRTVDVAGPETWRRGDAVSVLTSAPSWRRDRVRMRTSRTGWRLTPVLYVCRNTLSTRTSAVARRDRRSRESIVDPSSILDEHPMHVVLRFRFHGLPWRFPRGPNCVRRHRQRTFHHGAAKTPGVSHSIASPVCSTSPGRQRRPYSSRNTRRCFASPT